MKLVYRWVVNGNKNRYSESQNFEVQQAHPRIQILRFAYNFSGPNQISHFNRHYHL